MHVSERVTSSPESMFTRVVVAQVPMGKTWGEISEGVRVEVPNTDSGLPMRVYWIAGIIKLAGAHAHTRTHISCVRCKGPSGSFSLLSGQRAGFKALLRYEGFDSDSSRDFWLNLCAPDIHPVGWCAAGGRPLVPPQCKREESER